MATITGVPRVERKELKWKIDRAEPLVLLEILPEEEYRKGHLPDAISVPPERVAELVPELVPDREAEIVVYCAHSQCMASRRAAQELEALGYTNVSAYEGGKRDWADNGLPLENETSPAVVAPGAVGPTGVE